MVKCSFCGKVLPLGTGTQYIKKNGVVLYFCSNKCEKNMIILKRKARETVWTEEYRLLKAKRLNIASNNNKK